MTWGRELAFDQIFSLRVLAGSILFFATILTISFVTVAVDISVMLEDCDTDQPIVGAEVEVFIGNSKVQEGFTNQSGLVTFPLELGPSYTFRFSHPDYRSDERTTSFLRAPDKPVVYCLEFNPPPPAELSVNQSRMKFLEVKELEWRAQSGAPSAVQFVDPANPSQVTGAISGTIMGEEPATFPLTINISGASATAIRRPTGPDWLIITRTSSSSNSNPQRYNIGVDTSKVQLNAESGQRQFTLRGNLNVRATGAADKIIPVELMIMAPRMSLSVSESCLPVGQNETEIEIISSASSPQIVDFTIDRKTIKVRVDAERFRPGSSATITVSGTDALNGRMRSQSVLIRRCQPENISNGVPKYEFQFESFQNPAHPCNCCPCDLNDGPDDVLLHSGEFILPIVDLVIPGRGFNWSFTRTYRSGGNFEGPLGNNWEFNYNRRLMEVSPINFFEVQKSFPDVQIGDVVRMNGLSRADIYRMNEDGTHTSPDEFYTRLTKNVDDTFTERNRDGTKITYAVPDENGLAFMIVLADRNSNTLHFEYDDDQLVRVWDTLGRPIDYRYNEQGYLKEIEDFLNRLISFKYDERGDLVEVTSPTVTGTPNGNDFPQGKTERYTYSSGSEFEQLNHNMLTITAPNEVAQDGNPRVILTYETDPESPSFGRLLSETYGGTNHTDIPAGGTVFYEYEFFPEVASDDFNTAVSKTTVTDRNGNLTEYLFNQNANYISIKEFTNRDVRRNDPSLFERQFEYNQDGERLRTVYPEGNIAETVFDENNNDRFQQGNALETVAIADEDRGGDQTEIRTKQTYEPIYNQLRTIIDPRGLDTEFEPQNGGSTSDARYTTIMVFDYQEGDNFAALAQELGVSETEVRELLQDIPMNLGDVNGDGITNQIAGNVIMIQSPLVNFQNGSNQSSIEANLQQEAENLNLNVCVDITPTSSQSNVAQCIVEMFTFNRFGQSVRHVDPEGNVTEFEYFPENDPDGDGRVLAELWPDTATGAFGYLKETRVDSKRNPLRNSMNDPDPTDIRMQFKYDTVGNIIETIDGRGIATQFVVNQLNQIVQVISPIEYDVFSANPIEPLELTDFGYIRNIFYDFNDNVVLTQIEDRGNTSNVDGNPTIGDLPFNVSNPDPVGGVAFVDSIVHYDILDNPVKTVSEVENGTNSKFLHTLFRYDSNENPILTILPEGNASGSIFDERDLLFRSTSGIISAPPNTHMAPNDPTNFDVRGGIPSTATYIYDKNENLIQLCDAEDTDSSRANNCEITQTDQTTFLYDGFDRLVSTIDAVGNQSVVQFDPISNVVRSMSFGPVGGESPTTNLAARFQQPISQKGILRDMGQPLLQVMEYRYDELNRVIQSDQLLFVSEGVQTERTPNLTDGASDLSKGNLTPNDVNPIPGLSELNLIGRISQRTEYDRNSRVTLAIEDDEDVYKLFYDGVNRTIRAIDPEGNVVETAYDDNHNVIEVKETDIAQLPNIPNEIFLTTYFYDSLNRLQQVVDNIGQTHFFRYDSRNNMVAMADAQGPMNGDTISRRIFSPGALTLNAINAFGNVTRYSFDGISRPLIEEKILTESGSGDGINLSVDLFGVKTRLPTPDTNQGGGDGIIRMGYTWDDNSLASTMIDDQGNVTMYLYDNLSRQILETKGITANTSPLDKQRILGSRNVLTAIAGITSGAPSISARLLDNQLAKAKAHLDSIKELFQPQANRVDDAPPTTIVYNYDRDSHVAILEDENDSEIFTKFDAIDRPIATRILRAGQNDENIHANDPRFSLSISNDPTNHSREFQNNFSLVIGTTKEDYDYDGLSRLVRATDNNDPSDPSDDSTITYAYDSLSRVIEETQQIGNLPRKAISSNWQAENLRTNLIYPSGRELNYTFDQLDRLNTISIHSESSPIVDYDYMGVSRVLQRLYPQNGTRMTFLNDANNSDVGYDGLRRVTQLRHLRDDNSLIVGFTHDYDRMNNKRYEEKLHDSVNSEMYRYDSVYRLIEFQRGQMNPAKTEIETFTTLPNALKHKTWTLDGANNWMANRVVTNDETGQDVVQEQSRQHTSFNEISKIADDNNTPQDVLSDDNGNLSEDERFLYEWDYKDRLKTITRNADNQLVAIYSYDVNNRRIRKDVRADGLAEVNATANTLGWFAIFHSIWIWSGSSLVLFLVLFAISLRLLPPQQKLRWKRKLYQYSTRLWTISLILTFGLQVVPFSSEILSYAQTTATSRANIIGITAFYYDGWQVLEERDDSDELIQQYVYGNYIDEALIMDQTNEERLFYHQNTLSSTFALTDSSGFTIKLIQYDPFGQKTIFSSDNDLINSSQLNNPYLFTGRRMDEESGLYYYRNRYYEIVNGRFIQRDPIGNWEDRVNQGNGYSYLGNNPINYLDPFGLHSIGDYLGWFYEAFEDAKRKPGRYFNEVGQAFKSGAQSVGAAIEETVTEAAEFISDAGILALNSLGAIPAVFGANWEICKDALRYRDEQLKSIKDTIGFIISNPDKVTVAMIDDLIRQYEEDSVKAATKLILEVFTAKGLNKMRELASVNRTANVAENISDFGSATRRVGRSADNITSSASKQSQRKSSFDIRDDRDAVMKHFDAHASSQARLQLGIGDSKMTKHPDGIYRFPNGVTNAQYDQMRKQIRIRMMQQNGFHADGRRGFDAYGAAQEKLNVYGPLTREQVKEAFD